MSFEYKLVRRVEFVETDMAGIVHYSNFFRYMEVAEAAFFRSIELSMVPKTEPPVGWPRVHVQCDYKAPLRFEDEVEIHLLVSSKKERSLSYQFRFRKLSGSPQMEVARGIVIVACTELLPGGKLRLCSIPPVIAEKIEVAPPELLK